MNDSQRISLLITGIILSFPGKARDTSSTGAAELARQLANPVAYRKAVIQMPMNKFNKY